MFISFILWLWKFLSSFLCIFTIITVSSTLLWQNISRWNYGWLPDPSFVNPLRSSRFGLLLEVHLIISKMFYQIFSFSLLQDVNIYSLSKLLGELFSLLSHHLIVLIMVSWVIVTCNTCFCYKHNTYKHIHPGISEKK